MEYKHFSVLLNESIEGLNIKPDGIYVDCTLGGAGHSQEILKRLSSSGHLYAFDQDARAIEASYPRLLAIGKHFTLIQSNFVNLKAELMARGVMKVDGILFDLGVSSPQLDDGSRGFSYHQEAKLDMRMDQTQRLSAYEVVNEYSFAKLYHIISQYGEEIYAKQIARAIEKAREKKPIETTLELVEIIKQAMPEKAKREKHPAKRTFQAIRIEVNRELEILPQAFEDAIDLLNVGGRIAIITFHSLEDRIAKDVLRKHATIEVPKGLPVIPDHLQPRLKLVNKKAIMATQDELTVNHRSHSARLRIAEKLK